MIVSKKYGKAYFKRRNKENYEKDKKIRKEYQALGSHVGETYTSFKRRWKKATS